MLLSARKLFLPRNTLPRRRHCANKAVRERKQDLNLHRLTAPPHYPISEHPKLKYIVDNTNWTSLHTTPKEPVISSSSSSKSSRWQRVKQSALISPEAVVEAFEAEYSPNEPVPLYLLNTAIIAYGKMQLGHRILDIVLLELEKGSFTLNRTHVTSLISALSRSGDLESVLVLYQLIKPMGIHSVTLISIIDSLTRSGHFELITVLWDDWRKTNADVPPINLYTTIAEAAIKADRYDVWIDAELSARKDYENAVATGKLSAIATSQVTAKHCIYTASLLALCWVPKLRLISDSERKSLTEMLRRWDGVRPALPGLPLTKAEIAAWKADIDYCILINDKHGPLPTEHEPSTSMSEHTTWNGTTDDIDEIEAHEARILEAVDKIKRNSESKPL